MRLFGGGIVFILLCGLVRFGFAASSPFSGPLLVTLSQPREASWKIKIQPEGARFKIGLERIQRDGKRMAVHGEFGPEVIDALFHSLNSDQDPFSGWTSDSDCFARRTYFIQLGSSRKTICSNQGRMEDLDQFQGAVQLILRDAGGKPGE